MSKIRRYQKKKVKIWRESDSIGRASQRPWTRLDECPDPVGSRPAPDTFPDPSSESDSSCFARSLNLPILSVQRFLCIFIEITNAGRPESRILWLPNPGHVSPRLACASLSVTASRKVQCTGLPAHTYSFPNVARIPRPQTRHDRRQTTLITDGQTSLLKAYVFSFFRRVWLAWGFEFSHLRSNANSNCRQPLGREMKELWQNFEQKAFSNTMPSIVKTSVNATGPCGVSFRTGRSLNVLEVARPKDPAFRPKDPAYFRELVYRHAFTDFFKLNSKRRLKAPSFRQYRTCDRTACDCRDNVILLRPCQIFRDYLIFKAATLPISRIH